MLHHLDNIHNRSSVDDEFTHFYNAVADGISISQTLVIEFAIKGHPIIIVHYARKTQKRHKP